MIAKKMFEIFISQSLQQTMTTLAETLETLYRTCQIDPSKGHILGSYVLWKIIGKTPGDLDVVLHVTEWRKLLRHPPPPGCTAKIEVHNKQLRYHLTGPDVDIEIFGKHPADGYPNDDFSHENLRDTLIVDEYQHRHYTLETYLKWKTVVKRPKDRAQLEELHAHPNLTDEDRQLVAAYLALFYCFLIACFISVIGTFSTSTHCLQKTMEVITVLVILILIIIIGISIAAWYLMSKESTTTEPDSAGVTTAPPKFDIEATQKIIMAASPDPTSKDPEVADLTPLYVDGEIKVTDGILQPPIYKFGGTISANVNVTTDTTKQMIRVVRSTIAPVTEMLKRIYVLTTGDQPINVNYAYMKMPSTPESVSIMSLDSTIAGYYLDNTDGVLTGTKVLARINDNNKAFSIDDRKLYKF